MANEFKIKNGAIVSGSITGITESIQDNSTKMASTAWVKLQGYLSELPVATASLLGAIKVGAGLAIDTNGVLSIPGVSSGTLRTVQTFTATAGQTTFTVSGGYSTGLLDVYLNGVLLTGSSVGASDGSTVVLTDAAEAGDIINVITYSPLNNGFINGTTDSLIEGTSNLYFTPTRVKTSISGTANRIAYNSTAGSFDLATIAGLSAGSYGSSTAVPVITVDSYGRVTAISTSSISGALTFTGDVTGTGTTGTSTTLTLANSGVTAGTYNNVATQVRPFTVDAKGRVTSIGTAVTITPAWSSITGTPTTLAGYGILDAYTKTEVDNLIQGLDPKGSVKVATTGNITLSGTQTIDGIAVAAGDRVLVKDQTTASANGIYVVAAGAWTRATDADSATELISAFVFVEQGTVNADTGWVCTNDSITLGTTSIAFAQFSGTGAYQAKLNGTGFVRMSGTTLSYITGTASQFVKADGSLDSNTYLTGNQSISLSGDATGSGTTSIAVTLANSGVTAGSYGSASAVPVITVDAKGRVTGVTTATISGALTFSGDVTGTGTTGTTTTLTLANSGATAGTYNNVTVNAKGLVTAGSNVAYLTGNQSITISGDASGTGTTAITLTLANSGVTAGTYNNVTVNAKGLITAGSNAPYLVNNQTITLSGDATGSGSNAITVTLANSGVTAGTYRSVTVNAKGLVTAGTNPTTISGYGITDFFSQTIGAGYAVGANSAIAGTDTLEVMLEKLQGQINARISGNQTITLSGDATGSGTTAIAVTLANSGVTAGTYTKVTVDAKGRVTSGATLAAGDIPSLSYLALSGGTLTGALTGTSATFTAAGSASSGSVNITSTDSFIRLTTTGGTVDKMKWDIRAISAAGFEALEFRTINDANAVFNTRMFINWNGQMRIPAYTSSTSFTGTATAVLAVDASGNIITQAVSAGGGTSLNGTGYVYMSGTTPSYVTGTSSQFVKANGTLDSNTYLTSYTETSTLANVTARGATTSTAIVSSNSIQATQFRSYLDGSNSIGSGGMYIANAANNRAFNTQLNAAGDALLMFGYNGTAWSSAIYSFSNTGSATFGTAGNTLYTGVNGFVRVNTNPGSGQSTALLLSGYFGDLSTDSTVDLDFVGVDGNSVVGSNPHARIGYTGAYNDLVNTSPDGEARGYFRIATRGEGSAGVLADRLLIDHTGTLRLLNYTTNGFLKFSNSNGTVTVDTTAYTPTNGTGASGTWGISISGNAATATQAGAVSTSDTRAISPSSHSSYRATFGFTSWANNSTSPYADYFHLRSYGDSSGGNDNLVMFRKDTLGIRIWQQSFGSATAYATYKDVAWTDGTNASGTWGINVTGNAGSETLATVTGRGATTSTLVAFNGKATFGNRSSASFNGNTTGLTINNTAEVRSLGAENPPALTWHYEGLATRHILMTSAGVLNVVAASNENSGVAVLAVNGNTVWHAGNLTNLNQLSNGPGYTSNTGTVTSVSGTGTVSGLTLTGTVTTSGSLTLGGTLSLTSGQVTTALGYTPYNSTNPNGYITSSSLSSYLALSGGTMSGKIVTPSSGSDVYGGAIEIRERGYVLATQSDWSYSPAITFHWGNRWAKRFGGRADGQFAVDDVPIVLNTGTWGISITGNAATTSQRAFSSDISTTGMGRFTGWYSGNASTALAAEIGISAGEGYVITYNRGTSAYGNLNIEAANVRLNPQGGIATVNGSQIVTNNGGTWGISITGNAATASSASSVAWSNVTGRPGWLSGGSYIESLSNANSQVNSGFYENGGGGTNWPSATWYNSINVRHSNQGNYHGFQIAMSYYDNNFWFRSYQGSGTFQSWAVALSSQNYNSYAPTLTGGNASGTWGISITGSAGSVAWTSVTGRPTAVSSFTNDSGYVTGGSSPTFSETYTNGWFRNNTNNTGLYNQNTTMHLSSTTNGYWDMSSTTTVSSIRFYTGGHLSALRGYVYADNSNQIGFLNSSGSWSLRMDNSGNAFVTGTLTESSSVRYKDNIKDLKYSLADITKLRGVEYTKKGTTHKEIGVIAEEVNAIIPEVVAKNSDGSVESVSYGRLTAVLIEAVKEQQKQINELKELLNNK